MKAIVIPVSLNIRKEPSDKSDILGKLYRGDIVYGPIKNGWIGFYRVFRSNGTVETLAGYASTAYTTETDEPEPPVHEIRHVIIIYANGDVSIDETRTVEAVKAALK